VEVGALEGHSSAYAFFEVNELRFGIIMDYPNEYVLYAKETAESGPIAALVTRLLDALNASSQ
jgi:hypothetical protein